MKATSQRLGTQTLAEGLAIENNGALIISPVTDRPSLQRMGIDTTKAVNVGLFTSGQKQFLDFHRNAVLLQSIRG
jgi:putative restriction endonuclease